MVAGRYMCRPVGASPGWKPKSITNNRQNSLLAINGKSKEKFLNVLKELKVYKQSHHTSFLLNLGPTSPGFTFFAGKTYFSQESGKNQGKRYFSQVLPGQN